MQGSAHGIHNRQRYILYRERCLGFGHLEYDEIGGGIDDGWNPFGLR